MFESLHNKGVVLSAHRVWRELDVPHDLVHHAWIGRAVGRKCAQRGESASANKHRVRASQVHQRVKHEVRCLIFLSRTLSGAFRPIYKVMRNEEGDRISALCINLFLRVDRTVDESLNDPFNVCHQALMIKQNVVLQCPECRQLV